MAETVGTVTLAQDFKRALNANVPLVGIETVDQAAVLRTLAKAMNGDRPVLVWEAVKGLRGFNKAGEKAFKELGVPQPMTIPFVEAMVQAERMPPDSVLFALNAHRQISDPQPMQAVWNLRDALKQNQRMVVLLAPKWTLPEELKHDVVLLIDPLPDRAHLSEIVTQQYKNSDLPVPEKGLIDKGIDAVQGLGAFETEQSAAMSMTKAGLDLPAVWDRKCKTVAATSEGGLTISQTPVRFADMGGNKQFKLFGQQVIDARWFSTVWFIDEIEKDMAAMHSDTSGTSQYQHKALLTFTQKYKVPAMLLIGQPGSGKTLGAHAIAGEAGVPLAEMNLGGLKGKHVGESEQNTNHALQTLLAISQGRLLLVATCNDVGTLAQSPELLRRFKLPKFYFDLPSAEERHVIWKISGTRYGVDITKRPDDTDWTGSEIDATCELASKLKITILAASEWIIPMAVSSRALVERRREQADGNYLSASFPGLYRRNRPVEASVPSGGRKIQLES